MWDRSMWDRSMWDYGTSFVLFMIILILFAFEKINITIEYHIN